MDLNPDWEYVADTVMGGVSTGAVTREDVAGPMSCACALRNCRGLGNRSARNLTRRRSGRPCACRGRRLSRTGRMKRWTPRS